MPPKVNVTDWRDQSWGKIAVPREQLKAEGNDSSQSQIQGQGKRKRRRRRRERSSGGLTSSSLNGKDSKNNPEEVEQFFQFVSNQNPKKT